MTLTQQCLYHLYLILTYKVYCHCCLTRLCTNRIPTQYLQYFLTIYTNLLGITPQSTIHSTHISYLHGLLTNTSRLDSLNRFCNCRVKVAGIYTHKNTFDLHVDKEACVKDEWTHNQTQIPNNLLVLDEDIWTPVQPMNQTVWQSGVDWMILSHTS